MRGGDTGAHARARHAVTRSPAGTSGLRHALNCSARPHPAETRCCYVSKRPARLGNTGPPHLGRVRPERVLAELVRARQHVQAGLGHHEVNITLHRADGTVADPAGGRGRRHRAGQRRITPSPPSRRPACVRGHPPCSEMRGRVHSEGDGAAVAGAPVCDQGLARRHTGWKQAGLRWFSTTTRPRVHARGHTLSIILLLLLLA